MKNEVVVTEMPPPYPPATRVQLQDDVIVNNARELVRHAYPIVHRDDIYRSVNVGTPVGGSVVCTASSSVVDASGQIRPTRRITLEEQGYSRTRPTDYRALERRPVANYQDYRNNDGVVSGSLQRRTEYI
jgi:hypothetical protein